MTWTIINSDARSIPLADKSVQCVVTSPPYWGLRDYGTATWSGGDEDHSHDRVAARNGRGGSGSPGKQTIDAFPSDLPAEVCSCGATRIDSQIGLEKTPEAYVEKIVAVFREVWRVLRDDGTAWVNLGDSYCGSAKGMGADGTAYGGTKQRTNGGSIGLPVMKEIQGLKPKNLVGIPWRVAFALQADGWYLRSDIIWSKPNPMPESVTDRPTKAHEYIFLLTKKERYFFDQDAVREEPTSVDKRAGRNSSCLVDKSPNPRKGMRSSDPERFGLTRNHGAPNESCTHEAGRNIRTVWEIATQPYPEAHFATFPEEIAIRCIKAGTSEKGACTECGAPWERVTEVDYIKNRPSAGNDPRSRDEDRLSSAREVYGSQGWRGNNLLRDSKTTGWQPTCKCDDDILVRCLNCDHPVFFHYDVCQFRDSERPALACECVGFEKVKLSQSPNPCIVLDPFSGAGTVPLVADKLNRRGIGLELKFDYCRMAERRCYDDAPLLGHTA